MATLPRQTHHLAVTNFCGKQRGFKMALQKPRKWRLSKKWRLQKKMATHFQGLKPGGDTNQSLKPGWDTNQCLGGDKGDRVNENLRGKAKHFFTFFIKYAVHWWHHGWSVVIHVLQASDYELLGRLPNFDSITDYADCRHLMEVLHVRSTYS